MSEFQSLTDFYTTQMSQARFQERFHAQKFVPAFKSGMLPMLGDGTLHLPSIVAAPLTDQNQGNLSSLITRCVDGRMDDSLNTPCISPFAKKC
jgi:hypothetical protein